MGSTSVTSFLTKLLRPDRKAKQKHLHENNRRYSAPDTDWADITEISTTTETEKKTKKKKKEEPEPGLKDKRDVRHSSQQNLAEAKKQRNSKTRNADSRKRQPTNFHSWLCVSGNTDTLDRTPLPPQDSDAVKKFNAKNSQKNKNSSDKISGDFLRNGEGKKNKENKNRYSAPPTGWIAMESSVTSGRNSRPRGEAQDTTSRTTHRELSPGVRYRFDGTLEKPYVFPAGLTFGPEGRRLQLRRTTSTEISGKSAYNPRPNEKIVKVDVHRSSTENILMEYSYEENCPDREEFDVRKAFYLKFDSGFTHPEESTNVNEFDDQENTRKPKLDARNEYHVNGNPKRMKEYEPRKQNVNRYSMPPKNDDFVYMGSFENLGVLSQLCQDNEESRSSFDVSGQERNSVRSSKRKNRSSRYSLPPKNLELVYMGSFENVNWLLNDGKEKACVLSLAGEDVKKDAGIIHREHDNRYGYATKEADQSEQNRNHEGSNHETLASDDLSGNCSDEVKCTRLDTPDEKSSLRLKFKRHSMPELAFPNKLSIAKDSSRALEHFEQNEDEDSFDTSFTCGRAYEPKQANPFSRRTGRSSCMPGNKRSVAPPPAVFVPKSSPTSTCVSTSVTNTGTSRRKLFSIPPPPSYTPPREEMVTFLAQMKEMACHKGSQTDLNIDLESLSMEDRDTSLRREEVRTIFACPTSNKRQEINQQVSDIGNHKLRNHGAQVRNHGAQVRNHGAQRQIAHTGYPTSTDLSAGLLDISEISQGSDEVFKSPNAQSCLKRDESVTTAMSKFTKKSATTNAFEPSRSGKSASAFCNVRPHHIYEEMPDLDSKERRDVHLSESSRFGASDNSSTTEIKLERQVLSSDPGVEDLTWKPVPHPRKLSSASTCSESFLPRSDNLTPLILKHGKQTSSDNRSLPVPKKRHSLTHSKSLSIASDYGKNSEEFGKTQAQRLTRTQSHIVSSTLEKNDNIRCSADARNNCREEENIYEDIDSSQHSQENIYEECGNPAHVDESGKQGFHSINKKKIKEKEGDQTYEEIRSPWEELKITSSSKTEAQQGRMISGHLPPETQQFYHYPSQKANIESDYDDNDDNADDEMSLSNDEEEDERIKKYSLRKCVSADDLLRSGSIIDRSMILAKRRRRRMQERKSKNKRWSYSEKEFKDFSHDWATTDILPRNLYSKRKTTSTERIYKHKASHTDSGHDSDIVSPCTSPDSRRHVDGILPENSEELSVDDRDSCVPPLGTLPRKPWEIRLRNKKYLRKSRSRENLLTITSGH